MTHPTELLAAYVDGSLSAAERDRVEAHLSTCAACREEIDLARAVVPALAALEDEPVPLGVTAPVLRHASADHARGWSATSGARRRPTRWTRLSLGLGGAAAASIAVILAITLGGGPSSQPTAAPAIAGANGVSGAPKEAARGVELEQQARDYDDASLRELADTFAAATPGTQTAQLAPSAAAKLVPPDPAVACLQRAGATFSARDRLVRLIQARFEGTPAYLGVFFEGPPGKAPHRVAIWVAATADCRILTIVSEAS